MKSDNSATVASVNKGTSRSPELLSLIQEIFWLAVRWNFKLSASFVPGKLNFLADRLSRLNQRHLAIEANLMLSNFKPCVIFCNQHMSQETFVWLQESWEMNL